MKIVLSRKGCDSAAGALASPIFSDGGLVSVPIPELAPGRGTCYRDISTPYGPLAAIVADLSRGRLQPDHAAHLDPDLDSASVPRSAGWRPLFGQAGAAESHLRRHSVGPGDIFLFFGWFRHVQRVAERLRYTPRDTGQHVIFGWLQVERHIPIVADASLPAWAAGHPHLTRHRFAHPDGLYMAADRLRLPAFAIDLPGAGVFRRLHHDLRLTGPESLRSIWQLPAWFHPDGRATTLSYHADASRWQRHNDHVRLRSVTRGQEFVLDCDDYPEAIDWLARLLAHAASSVTAG